MFVAEADVETNAVTLICESRKRKERERNGNPLRLLPPRITEESSSFSYEGSRKGREENPDAMKKMLPHHDFIFVVCRTFFLLL